MGTDMGELEWNADNHWVAWTVPANLAQKDILEWKMLEHNAIKGILSFDYYYIDHQICFRYPFYKMQRVTDYFKKKEGSFEDICFLCEGILRIMERGEEYLLDSKGYLCLPEWVLWNRLENKLAICYLLGREEKSKNDYAILTEYLMQHTNHTDKKAVAFIYGLYDTLLSEGLSTENLLLYVQQQKEGTVTWTDSPQKSAGSTKQSGKFPKTDNAAGQTDKLLENEKSTQQTNKPLKNKQSAQQTDSVCYFSLKPVRKKQSEKLYQWLIGNSETITSIPQKKELVVGRREGSGLCLPFAVISRRHAVFSYDEGQLYLMDTASTNGTRINDRKISAYVKSKCQTGDILTFADISFKLEISGK